MAGYQPLRNDDSEDDHTISESAPASLEKSRNKIAASKIPRSTIIWKRWRRRPRMSVAIILGILVLVSAIIAGSGIWVFRTDLINGQSPPWYPSPRGGTLPTWQESYRRAQAMVEKMSLVEKVNITTGTGWAMDLCVGNTGSALAAGFPSLCLQDGPLGLRFVDHATSFPAGITVGSTWNRSLMRRRGMAHGREARMKGVNVLLGPAMGPFGRNPAGGRNWEGFGPDPVVQGIAAYETILGIQSQGIMATAKHFVGNEQEHFRQSFEWGLPQGMSSNIDDRTMHEIYAWPFADSVRAGVVSIMCSYQMVNNSYACGNSKLLNGILKDELGFQGFVQSDWLAQRSGVASALAGLDMSMPGDGLYWQDGNALFGDKLTLAVLNGSIPMTRINDMVTRIVAAWYQVSQDLSDSEGPNFSSWTDEKIGKWHSAASNSQDTGEVNKFVYAPNDESVNVAREIAAEGVVLLKNRGVLPLHSETTSKIMIIGEDAGPGKGPNYCADRGCNQGTLAVGWGSGATDFMYLVNPLSALQKAMPKANISNHLLNTISTKIHDQLKQQDLCLVFANADSGEGFIAWDGVRGDRNDLELQKGGTKLIKAVADLCGGPVVVVIHAVGPVIIEEFIDHPNVKAVLHANLPGQESGNGLVDVLLGNTDASGRLVFTMGKSLDDYGEGAKVLYYPNGIIPQVNFNEGLYVDYRHFDKYGIEPRFPFGYGLSYTTFEYTELDVVGIRPKSALPDPRPATLIPPKFADQVPEPASAVFPTNFTKLNKYVYPYISSIDEVHHGQYPLPDGYDVVRAPSEAGGAEGGNPSLFEDYVTVRIKIVNTGNRKGKEVVQLYLSLPANVTEAGVLIDTPVKVLRNFQKVELEAGAYTYVQMNLTRKDLSYWSVLRQNWVMPVEGKFEIYAARSSRDLRLREYW